MSLAESDRPAPAPGPALVQPRWTTRGGLLEIDVEFDDGVWLLKLAGELDLSNVRVLEGELRAAEASFADRIVIDLEALTFLDTSGLHALVRAERRSRRGKPTLCLIPGPRAVQNVFRLTGTEDQLPFESRPLAA